MTAPRFGPLDDYCQAQLVVEDMGGYVVAYCLREPGHLCEHRGVYTQVDPPITVAWETSAEGYVHYRLDFVEHLDAVTAALFAEEGHDQAQAP